TRAVGLARIYVSGERAEFFVDEAVGSDDHAGTRSAPFATIQHGIDAAASSGVADVFVAGGSYVETLSLATGVAVYGGYDPATWMRDPDLFRTDVFGGKTAIVADGVEEAVLDGVRVWSADATEPGESSVGIRLTDSRAVAITGNVITAGRGGAGTGSANQPAAPNGEPGVTGFEGGVRITIPPGGAGGQGGAGGFDGGAGGQGQVG
ncbi:MAG: hypothetical protein GWM90_26405, partial [Gemmatimonadetes bacterium]|nr:hypothetical protein [Gemmatimonadota bacterium]NIQ58418.1 hypothetical protein [Gemmatimonadota bacterium]NIU78629.1 hypothetical protein [Gammaproteobacteria bacterium]NIX47472.1 hypothetical protein [Gemmatimonadota bacterium]NIY11855.1 hypothetical protein [Gemmatimonadota bacterium]